MSVGSALDGTSMLLRRLPTAVACDKSNRYTSKRGDGQTSYRVGPDTADPSRQERSQHKSSQGRCIAHPLAPMPCFDGCREHPLFHLYYVPGLLYSDVGLFLIQVELFLMQVEQPLGCTAIEVLVLTERGRGRKRATPLSADFGFDCCQLRYLDFRRRTRLGNTI